VSLVAGGGRDELAALATQQETVDLIIPRGGAGLKAALEEVATVPVIYAAAGNCHVYVDASADLDAAERIVLNAKVQRPGVCNAAETLLIHEDIAAQLVPRRPMESANLQALGWVITPPRRTIWHGSWKVMRVSSMPVVRSLPALRSWSSSSMMCTTSNG